MAKKDTTLSQLRNEYALIYLNRRIFWLQIWYAVGFIDNDELIVLKDHRRMFENAGKHLGIGSRPRPKDPSERPLLNMVAE